MNRRYRLPAHVGCVIRTRAVSYRPHSPGRLRCRHRERRHHARQRRFAWRRESDSSQPADHADHSPKSFLRFHLQRARRAHCGGITLSVFRNPTQSYHRERSDELQFRLGRRECAKTPSRQTLNSLNFIPPNLVSPPQWMVSPPHQAWSGKRASPVIIEVGPAYLRGDCDLALVRLFRLQCLQMITHIG